MQHVFSIARVRNFEDFQENSNVDVEPPLLVSPVNTPLGSGIGKSLATPLGGTVNVVSDFYWTYSKLIDSRKEVPRLLLTERRLKTNAMVNQLKYSFGVSKSNIREIAKVIPDGVKNPLYNFLTGARQSETGQKAAKFANTVEAKLAQLNAFQDNNNIFENNPYLKPYQNLYITEPTGWQFILPYFENLNNSQTNAFADDTNQASLGILKMGAEMLGKVSDITAALRTPTQVTFVEKTKFYNYGTEGDQVSVNFPLINTGSATFDDVVRNWELLFLLLYNNKPSRKNVSVIDPPVIYTAEIPGVKFFPFCYIADMTIEFQGSRRELTFNLDTIDSLNVDKLANTQGQIRLDKNNNNLVRGFSNNTTLRSITTIIPDAYQVKITFKSLVPDSKNFMYTVLNKDPIVSASTLSPNVNSVLNPLASTARQNQQSVSLRPNDSSIPAPDVNTGINQQ
jgi:hypothetical protein